MFKGKVENIIRARHSVRSYDNKEISKEIINDIEKFIDNLESPFDNKVEIKIIRQGYSNENKKLGTYGMIKGASYFLVVVCQGEEFDHEALGYALEQVVLYCTSLGLGTCWMGGTFNKGNFAKAVNLKENQIIPIVSPLGYESEKNTLISAFLKKNNSKRKPFEELFFNKNFKTPLIKEEAKEYGDVLEMVRLAPSAMNKQPWRIVKDNNKYHFYCEGKLEMQKVDMGIALCNFNLMANELGLNGKYKKENPDIEAKGEYIISWIG